jgi:hypothetical protein
MDETIPWHVVEVPGWASQNETNGLSSSLEPVLEPVSASARGLTSRASVRGRVQDLLGAVESAQRPERKREGRIDDIVDPGGQFGVGRSPGDPRPGERPACQPLIDDLEV